MALLASAMLKYLFGIEWQLPEGHLCPTIPSRINYLNWVNAIYSRLHSNKIQKVVDVGTGAGLIYPVLGRCLFDWEFTATDIDAESLQNCRLIIRNNPQLSGIELLHSREGLILAGVVDGDTNYNAVVCNPPFFDR